LKFLIINITLLLLITQSFLSRDNTASLINHIDIPENQYIINQTSSNLLISIDLFVNYGGTPPPDYGIAKLEWIFTDGATDKYVISRNIAGAGWITIDDNVPGTYQIYNDTIPDGYCNVFIEYRIEAIDNGTGQTIISNTEGKVFTESRQPNKPVLDSVSINANGNVVLGWSPNVSVDVTEIIIYRKVGNIWPPNAEVIIPLAFYYEDLTQNPCVENNLQYAIATIDGCGNKSTKTEQTAQRPIFLHDLEYDVCSNSNFIIWESYINATPPLEEYQIWASINNGVMEKVDVVSASDTSYTHTNVEYSTNYTYFIRAKFGNSTSTSCNKSITTGNFIKPNYLYLANANVLPDNNIDLTIDLDLQPNYCSWEILRSDTGGGSQSILTSFSRSEVSTSPFLYLDETADGSLGYYNYSLNVFDSCGVLTLQSNIMKTIFLEGQHLNDIENHITWNSFEGFEGGVDKYYIFRILGDIIPTVPIDSTVENEYTDDISMVDASVSEFSYWVQAVEGIPNSYGYNERSNSNIITLFKETDLYFPNAFRPNGTNKVFKPVASGFGGSNYLFQIFNRWGQLIFVSTDPELGWDGKYKGKQSPQGTYIYRFVYQNVYGITKQQQGSVTLIE
jgi:gliding motility-associated-like protein